MKIYLSLEYTDKNILKLVRPFLDIFTTAANQILASKTYGFELDTFRITFNLVNPDFYKNSSYPVHFHFKDEFYHARKRNEIYIRTYCRDFPQLAQADEAETMEIFSLMILKGIRISKRVRLKAFNRQAFYDDMVSLILEKGWIRDPELILPFDSAF